MLGTVSSGMDGIHSVKR